MAQDPEEEQPGGESSVNTSHDLDMVSLYRSTTVDAEIEADIISGILDSHNIPTLKSRAMGYPSLGFEVLVPRERLRDAERLIEEAKAAGPAAALEAEQATEEDQ